MTGTVAGVASKIGTFIGVLFIFYHPHPYQHNAPKSLASIDFSGNAAYSAVSSKSEENSNESDPDSFMGKLKQVVNDPRTQSTINIGKHGVNAIGINNN